MTGKPVRLLATGKVHIPDVDRAVVDGDHGRYTVVWDGEWSCECLGWLYRRTCSHVDAVRAVTQPPKVA